MYDSNDSTLNENTKRILEEVKKISKEAREVEKKIWDRALETGIYDPHGFNPPLPGYTPTPETTELPEEKASTGEVRGREAPWKAPQDLLVSKNDNRENVYKFLDEIKKPLNVFGIPPAPTRTVHSSVSGRLYVWTGKEYSELSEAEENKLAYRFFDGKYIRGKEDGNDLKYPVSNKSQLQAFIDTLKTEVLILKGKDYFPIANTSTHWLFDQYKDGSMIIPFKNCLFNLKDYLEKDDLENAIESHNAEFFNHSHLPYNFSSAEFTNSTRRPTVFLSCLQKIWGEDWIAGNTPTIDFLFEWMGLSLIDCNLFQKMLLMIGAPGQGKGMICRIWQRLLGKDNYITPSASSLCKNFALTAWKNKLAAFFLDDCLPSFAKDLAEVEGFILRQVGGDEHLIDTKFRDSEQIRLPARIVWVSNSIPPFTTNAFKRRLMLLSFPHKILVPDPKIEEEIIEKELPYIMYEAIRGLKRLLKRGYFIQPGSGQEILDEISNQSNPLSIFIKEQCFLDPEYCVSIQKLYNAYTEWAKGEGYDPIIRYKFVTKFLELQRGIRRGQTREEGRVFWGIGHYSNKDLKKEDLEKYYNKGE